MSTIREKLKHGSSRTRAASWVLQDAPIPGNDRSDPASAEQQTLLFTDPVAFRYFASEKGFSVVQKRLELPGYELYLVEQWACSRVDPTSLIVTYTGQKQHAICVDVLRVPADETRWSPRLQVYTEALIQSHARRKETPSGSLMVTNLSSFPSALTVIPVPDGDIRSNREAFVVNENLKRLGCSGRMGLTLSPPTEATRAKFMQTYQTSEVVSLNEAVIELVKLTQIALMLFDLLPAEYADGLLCDFTERAINEWWSKIGSEFFNTEPSDGILGPTTVAAILGLLQGARNRLHANGAPVAKDVFDVRATKRAIGYFQRWQKLPQSRRLDIETLDRLHRVTSKVAKNEGWAVPKAVKSTVAELSGKGGEMVRGMVGRDKAGIAEIETVDINKFIDTLSGERTKWLWRGKIHKTQQTVKAAGSLGIEDEAVVSSDDRGGLSRNVRRKDSATEPPRVPPAPGHLEHLYSLRAGSQSSLDQSDKESVLRKTVLRSVTGRMSDAKTGLGRFKDAVGLPSLRTSRGVRDSLAFADADQFRQSVVDQTSSPPSSPIEEPSQSSRKLKLFTSSNPQAPAAVSSRRGSATAAPGQRQSSRLRSVMGGETSNEAMAAEDDDIFSQTSSPRGAGGVPGPEVLSSTIMQQHPKQEEDRAVGGSRRASTALVLRRTWSLGALDHLDRDLAPVRSAAWRLRSLSCSLIDDLALSEAPDADTPSDFGDVSPAQIVGSEQLLSEVAFHQLDQLQQIERDVPLSQDTLRTIAMLYEQLSEKIRDLDAQRDNQTESLGALERATDDLVAEERASLADALRELEVLGARLEYELGAVMSKLEDVEDGVVDFERQVQYLEERLAHQELEHAQHEQAWYRRWFGDWLGI